jgi:hypothetical protein
MKDWAAENGDPKMSAAIPLTALQQALVRSLDQFPTARRRLYADEFIKALNHSLQLSAD